MSNIDDCDSEHSGRILELIPRMTAAEKIAQLGGRFPFHFLGDSGSVESSVMKRVIPDGIGEVSGAALLGAQDPRRLAQQANAIQRYHVEETRLGIPTILHNEALCGMMYGPATSFPTAINLAATWQPDLIRQMADLTRRQMRAVGVLQALSPVLDVARDARWGRVHETYGEDPILCAACGVAFVEGLQGDDLRQGVIATAKHFLGYGLSEGALNQAAVHLGPRELYEVFALPFEAAIREAGLASVMNSYSEIDGVPVAASSAVLTALLRHELGFAGFVVADYGSVKNNISKHFVAVDERDAAAQALDAGLDVELPDLRCFRELGEGLESGEIDPTAIDRAVARVLEAKFRLGLFEDPYCAEEDVTSVFYPGIGDDLARTITERSLVLLENDGILPLGSKAQRIGVSGPFADSVRLMFAGYTAVAADELNIYMAAGLSGTMAGIDIDSIDIDTIGEVIFGTRERALDDADVERHTGALNPTMPTLVEALRDAAANAIVDFARGCHFRDTDDSAIEDAVALARRSDVMVCAVGEKSGWVGQATGGEGRDRLSLDLPGNQCALLRALQQTGTPVVIVLVSGRPLVIETAAAAVLWAGNPGRHGPKAIADLLLGTVRPSGRLPISFPRAAGQSPLYASHKAGSGSSTESALGHVDSDSGPRFSFGHGLSYASPTLSDLELSTSVALFDETVTVSCAIANDGDTPLAEVVQLYLRDRQASVTRPVRQLAGFLRVELDPGERRRIEFHLAISQTALLDREYRLVVEPGLVDIMIGRSAAAIELSAQLMVDGDVSELAWRGPFYAHAELI